MRILAEPQGVVARATDPNRLLWLTTADVARMLALSDSGVRWLAREGRLPCETTQAGQRLFRERDVQRFAEQRMRARLKGLAQGPRVWVRGEPRQLPLFGATLRIVAARCEAKEVLPDPAAKDADLLREFAWVR